MATHHGKDGKVKVGANTVAEVQSWEFEHSVDLEEDHAMGDTTKTRLAGFEDWSGSLTCSWDETDTAQNALTPGATVALALYPEGDSAGDTYWSGNAIIGSMSLPVAKDGRIEVEFEFAANGDITKSTV